MLKMLGIAFILGFAGVLAAQNTATPATSLLVLAKSDRMLAIVDPATLSVVARVPVGPEPHENSLGHQLSERL